MCVVLLASSLAGCSAGSKALFTFRGTSLSSGMYSYMLSSQKAFLKQLFDYYNSMSYYYYQTYYFGTADFDEYLRSAQTDSDGSTVTVAESTNKMVIDSAKSMVIINHFCDQYKLSVTDTSTIELIDSTLSEDIEAAGSVDYLNILLAQYGADYDIEKKYLYDSSSSKVLYDYLYGDSGIQRLDDSVVKEYFENMYYKVNILSFSYYDTDADTGDKTVKEVPGITEEKINEYIVSKYSKVRQILFYTVDVNTLNPISEEKKAEKAALAAEVLEKLKSGNVAFEEARAQYSEDSNDGAVLISEGSQDARIKTVEETALSMNVGEYELVKSDIGIHILIREEITDDDISDTLKSSAYTDLAIKAIQLKALTAYDALKDGTFAFEGYQDDYGKFTAGVIFGADEVEEDIHARVSAMSFGDYTLIDMDGASYLMQRVAFGEDDYRERYDDIYEILAEEDYQKYIQSFYSEVIIDEAELAKFSFLTANPLDLVPLDETES